MAQKNSIGLPQDLPEAPISVHQRLGDDSRWILSVLVSNCATSLNPGLWRHPDDKSTQYNNAEYWQGLAQLLERGRFTSIFFADTLGPFDAYKGPHNVSQTAATGAHYPISDPLMPVLVAASVTKSEHPVDIIIPEMLKHWLNCYRMARRLSTIDHLTNGRLAINIVTSALESAADSLGFDKDMSHEERYTRADEFMDVFYKLLESSWRDNAVVLDADRGIYTLPGAVRRIEHNGKYYKCAGSSQTEPSPQRTPLLFQAGSSKVGMAFASRHAEGVFVNGPTPEILRRQVDNIRAEAESRGRDPRSVKVLMKQFVILGDTDEAARAKEKALRNYVDIEASKTLIGGWLGEDMSLYNEDDDLAEVGSPALKSIAKMYQSVWPKIKRWTPNEMAREIGFGSFEVPIVGSPSTVADALQRWIDIADVDGFNFTYAISPGSFEDLVDLLVPELQRRGVHWTNYPERSDGKAVTAREALLGLGQTRFRDDHYAAKFRWRENASAPPCLSSLGE